MINALRQCFREAHYLHEAGYHKLSNGRECFVIHTSGDKEVVGYEIQKRPELKAEYVVNELFEGYQGAYWPRTPQNTSLRDRTITRELKEYFV